MNFSKFLGLEDVFMTGLVRERANVCYKSLDKLYLYKYKNRYMKKYESKKLIARKYIFWHGSKFEDRKIMWEKWMSHYQKNNSFDANNNTK